MLLKKSVNAKIPSVQYGNVDFFIGLEHNFEVSGTPIEIAQAVRKEGALMDKIMKFEYDKFYTAFAEDEKTVEKLTTLHSK